MENDVDAGPVPELVQGIRPLVAAPTAFDLLLTASGFVEIVTERPMYPLGPERMEKLDGPDFLGSLLDAPWPELVVLGKAMATLLPDGPLVRQLLAQPIPPDAPSWASTMDSIVVTGTYAQNEPLGDSVNLWVCVQWPDGSEATAILFVDHNMGSLLKDAFFLSVGADEVMSTMRRVTDDFIEIEPFGPDDLRARFEWSLDRRDRTISMPETETWPACRPLVEWIVGHLPAGGSEWAFPSWTEAERDQLVDEFATSPFGRGCSVSADVLRVIAENLVWHGCDYGSGDPLRWSPIVVELVLTDWFPRKIYGLTQADIDAVPAVLEAFVAFAHDRCGADADDTRTTVSSIVVWEDDFAAAMAAQQLAGEDVEVDGDDVLLRAIFGDQDESDYMVGVTNELEARVIDLVGGRQAYDALGDAPLEDVVFDWSVVPDDMVDLTRETLELLDTWSGEHLDDEVRSIARATLGALVENDRSVFKRSVRTDVFAAAILGYLIRRLTERFDRKGKANFGWSVTSVSRFADLVGLPPATVGARVKTIANVMDRADFDWSGLLHSTQRRTALETKQHIADFRAGH